MGELVTSKSCFVVYNRCTKVVQIWMISNFWKFAFSVTYRGCDGAELTKSFRIGKTKYLILLYLYAEIIFARPTGKCPLRAADRHDAPRVS
jgi:hypothetical protein